MSSMGSSMEKHGGLEIFQLDPEMGSPRCVHSCASSLWSCGTTPRISLLLTLCHGTERGQWGSHFFLGIIFKRFSCFHSAIHIAIFVPLGGRLKQGYCWQTILGRYSSIFTIFHNILMFLMFLDVFQNQFSVFHGFFHWIIWCPQIFHGFSCRGAWLRSTIAASSSVAGGAWSRRADSSKINSDRTR